MLSVNEIFGPTFQGEGTSMGRPAIFLRLGGCNLTCSFCDTPFTWVYSAKKAELHRDHVVYDPAIENTLMSTDDVIEALIKQGLSGTRTLVISGGEPLLQVNDLSKMILDLTTFHRDWVGRIEIETNGTKMPKTSVSEFDERVQFNVSPKLENSGISKDERLVGRSLQEYARRTRSIHRTAVFKFVVMMTSDFDEIQGIVDTLKIAPDAVYIMPEGIDAGTVTVRLRELAEETIRRGWNLTTRLHVLVWGNKRAV